MKDHRLISLAFLIFAVSGFAGAQGRTVTKTDRFDFGAGGTVTITGAPNGSISVVGTAKNEIEIAATVAIEGGSAADQAKLAEVTGFVLNESAIRASVGTIGSHNKFGLKKLPKDFPKHLIQMPFRVDYVISVPRYTDLEIDGGKGDLSIKGVEGSMRVNFLETKGHLEVTTGNIVVAIGSGELDLVFAARGWRGRSANVSIGRGDLIVRLPSNLSAEIDAIVLKTGSIENLIPDLKPRDRKIAFTERSIAARAGVGGPPLRFTVGDGSMRLKVSMPL